MWVSSIMGLDKLILPDGRNRPGGNMTSVSVIGNTDSWWDEHYASTRQCLPKGENVNTVCLPEKMSQIHRGIRNNIPKRDTM